ncbi:hypothetical protein GCM10027049_28430 [Mucilaginibacter puniceus]
METLQIATRLVQLCRENKNIDAVNELYSDDIVSKEPKGSHRELTNGKADVISKNEEWVNSLQEIHSEEISDPLIAGNFFSVSMYFDATYKEHGRVAFTELCVYEVKDGKIVAEEFFYNLPG